MSYWASGGVLKHRVEIPPLTVLYLKKTAIYHNAMTITKFAIFVLEVEKQP